MKRRIRFKRESHPDILSGALVHVHGGHSEIVRTAQPRARTVGEEVETGIFFDRWMRTRETGFFYTPVSGGRVRGK